MKLFLHSSDLTEVRHEQQRGVIAGVTVDDGGGGGAGAGDDRRLERLAALAALVKGPVCVAVRAGDLSAMTGEATALAAVAPNVVVGLPATTAGLAAIRRCVDRGIVTQLCGYRSPADIELGGRAGARWFSPALGPAPGSAEIVDGVRLAVAIRRIYGRTSPVLAGPLGSVGAAFDAGVAGAEVASVAFPVLQRLLSPAPARA